MKTKDLAEQVHYCDGASYTGDRELPVEVDGDLIYYRGKRIRDAVIEYLLSSEGGMAGAEDIVISGTSAGGLGIYLNIDQIAAQIPNTARVRGLASAGYFLALESAAGGYQDQMLQLAQESNSTGALSPACLIAAAKDGRAAESCFFAEYAAPHIVTPTFALQSRFDTWQLAHIPHISTTNKSGVVGYGELIRRRMSPLITNARTTTTTATTATTATATNASDPKPKHAVWLSPCETHGLGVTGYWTKSMLNGSSISDAFDAWFSGELDGKSRAWLGETINEGCIRRDSLYSGHY